MTENPIHTQKIPRARTVRELARRLEQMAAARRSPGNSHPQTTGIPALDALLPEGGFRAGILVEWLAEAGSSDLLALLSARALLRDGATLVVLDRDQTFHATAAIAWGIAARQTIVVRPKTAAEELWALEQCLQSAGVAVSLCRLARATSSTLRRLQLAAEKGGGLGFLLRPLSTRGQPAWSDVRLLVTSLVSRLANRRWRVELVRSRRGAGETSVILELDDATGAVSQIAELAPAIRGSQAARA